MNREENVNIPFNHRTDLALESHETYLNENQDSNKIDGVLVKNIDNNNVSITRIEITNDNGASVIGKPIGAYSTIEIPSLVTLDMDGYNAYYKAVSDEIRQMVKLEEDDVVLIVGLGNRSITADALGPKVVESIMITRHIKEYLGKEASGFRSVSAITPGVLGITGVETFEIVKGVVEHVKPKLVIGIDALCAFDISRIATTLQISNTGISPGSGIGNQRKAINKESLGVDVIAIGVPTVIDGATIVKGTIELMQSKNGENSFGITSQNATENKRDIIKEVLEPYNHNLLVTPKAIDNVIEKMAKILAKGINLAMHEGITVAEIDNFLA